MRPDQRLNVGLMVIVGSFALVCGNSSHAAEKSLASVAKESGCRGGPTDYVSGYPSPGDKSAGVFWCARDPDAEKDRFLIVVVNRRPSTLKCPSILRSINRPLKIRILRDEKIPLSWFAIRDKPSQTGPATGHTNGPVIDTGDDGVGEQWFCYNGTWLVRVYH